MTRKLVLFALLLVMLPSAAAVSAAELGDDFLELDL